MRNEMIDSCNALTKSVKAMQDRCTQAYLDERVAAQKMLELARIEKAVEALLNTVIAERDALMGFTTAASTRILNEFVEKNGLDNGKNII